MRERKSGKIINVSSAAGFQPIPFMATYAATKAFVSSFSEAIAEENRPFGIQVLTLCPGSTATNFFAASNIDPANSGQGPANSRGCRRNRSKAVPSKAVKKRSFGFRQQYRGIARHIFTDLALITRDR
ncbi:MAG: SDR family NAD(P)-dependent oxidoreductase [Chloracidobacterium sp.]|nr:SDR family NAD(P)-dependent oxidoreductase [Chloracidobacterium sp.]